tara:strand:- start:115033 stop:116253 length:1221 start_codon:yes stop_codon:yes gene_type:complete
MTVVFERPYRAVPPYRGNLWPSFIQRFRVVDWYLKSSEGVVSYECRHLDRLQDSVDRGDGILLAPNHCRYADPLVMGWPARHIGVHLYAMASWHLFNNGWFDSFALRRMGAFSIFREGTDRAALEHAINILSSAERPLVVFPEGTTNRTNDVLKPMLDGVMFMARSAARRRAKYQDGDVVVHPCAIKYLCRGDVSSWAATQLDVIEQRLGFRSSPTPPLRERLVRLVEALLALKEVEYSGRSESGDLRCRRDQLIELLLNRTEERNGLAATDSSDVRDRVRAIRAHAAARYFASELTDAEKGRLRDDVVAADLAQELLSYPDSYLQPETVTESRIVETIQRIQESLFGKADVSMPLHAVIECDDAIKVPPQKAPRGQADPLMQLVGDRLQSMIDQLATESPRIASD